jgi:hypothetical protein
MLPDSDDLPPAFAKLPVDSPVATSIPLKLGFPVFDVARWHPEALWAMVPEASVNEENKSLSRENEVRPARQLHVAAPPADAEGAKQGNHSLLS